MIDFEASRVEALLDEGVRDLVHKALFIRLAMLKREAVGSSRAAALQPVFDLIGQFPAVEVCQLATPFFWFNALRCEGLAEGAAGDVAVAGLAVTAADSLLPFSPPGTRLRLGLPARAEGYAFPRIGRRFQLCEEAELVHQGEGRIIVTGAGAEAEGAPIVLPIPGHDGVDLLLSNDPVLFHDDYRFKIVADTGKAQELASLIGQALDLIQTLSPGLAARMNGLVQWYVPIGSDDFKVHNSFTASTLLGVIFLSDAYSSLRLAEAMVHEYHHNQLFSLMAGETLFEDVDGAIYYSPWREDPRPLTGLFHALYVFANVWAFMRLAQARPEFSDMRPEIEAECDRLRWQLEIGLRQIPRDRILPAGEAILGDVEQVARLAAIADAPDRVIQHMRGWRNRNPGLALHGA